MRSPAEGQCGGVCSREAVVRSPGSASHTECPLLQPQLPQLYSGVIAPPPWGRHEHQMTYDLPSPASRAGHVLAVIIIVQCLFSAMPVVCSISQPAFPGGHEEFRGPGPGLCLQKPHELAPGVAESPCPLQHSPRRGRQPGLCLLHSPQDAPACDSPTLTPGRQQPPQTAFGAGG